MGCLSVQQVSKVDGCCCGEGRRGRSGHGQGYHHAGNTSSCPYGGCKCRLPAPGTVMSQRPEARGLPTRPGRTVLYIQQLCGASCALCVLGPASGRKLSGVEQDTVPGPRRLSVAWVSIRRGPEVQQPGLAGHDMPTTMGGTQTQTQTHSPHRTLGPEVWDTHRS